MYAQQGLEGYWHCLPAGQRQLVCPESIYAEACSTKQQLKRLPLQVERVADLDHPDQESNNSTRL